MNPTEIAVILFSARALKIALLSCVLLNISLEVSAQSATTNTASVPSGSSKSPFAEYWSGVLQSFTLKYTTANLKQSQQPATLQYVDNIGGKANSYSIDGALSVNLVPTSSFWYFGPTAEYHKNNTTTKPQDNLQLGLTSYELWYLPNNTGHPHADTDYIFTQETLTYVHDKITVGNDSLFPQVDVSACVKNWGLNAFYFPFPETLRTNLAIMWIPDLGIQYQSGNNIEQSNKSGAEARGKASLEFDMYPFTRTFHQKLKLYVAETYWRAAFASGEYNSIKNDFSLLKAGISVFLDDKQRFSVGCDYSNGENVETGLPNEKMVTLSLQAKF